MYACSKCKQLTFLLSKTHLFIPFAERTTRQMFVTIHPKLGHVNLKSLRITFNPILSDRSTGFYHKLNGIIELESIHKEIHLIDLSCTHTHTLTLTITTTHVFNQHTVEK